MQSRTSKEKKALMPIVNEFAAGIDVGSRFHYVAIGQKKDNVRKFGCYTSDLHELCNWLKNSGVTTVALESTGSYWQSLFIHLQDYGLKPLLVNGKYTKNVTGKKTDVLDCQWIQKLHSLGLLAGSFIPDLFTEKLRQYSRHRDSLVDDVARYINKIQKALRLMNIRLDTAITEVTGLTGRTIITAILDGERDAQNLASMAHHRIKKSKEELVLALTGDWREEYIFELRHCYELYCYYKSKITECDTQIQTMLESEVNTKVTTVRVFDRNKIKRVRRNDPNINLQELIYRLSGGIDLGQIEGVGVGMLMSIVSEIGFNVECFPTAKHFTSWLRLAPNTKISGGKVLTSKTKTGKNRLAEAFRHAANGIGNTKKGGMLQQFFKRIEYRKGRVAAIVATARKLAVIIWTLLYKKVNYNPIPPQSYLENMRKRYLKSIQRNLIKLNVRPEEVQFAF